jgi:hypothetical protein
LSAVAVVRLVWSTAEENLALTLFATHHAAFEAGGARMRGQMYTMIARRDGGFKPPYRWCGGSANGALAEAALGRADVVLAVLLAMKRTVIPATAMAMQVALRIAMCTVRY